MYGNIGVPSTHPQVGILKNSKIVVYCNYIMVTCSVCGEDFSDDIRFLNHMMEKHGFRNPNVDKPDRNSRGY